MEGACFYFPLNGGWLIRGGGLNRGRGLNCYSLSAPTVRTYLRMPKIQITNYWTRQVGSLPAYKLLHDI